MGRRKKDIVEKSPFKLRRKRLANGRESLYLDHATNGKHEYEYLQLYLLPETTSAAKRQNVKTLREAEEIARQRTEELLTAKAKKPDVPSSDMLMLEWIDVIREDYVRCGKSDLGNLSRLKHSLSQFRPEAKLKDVDKQFIIDYINWLRTEYRTRWGSLLAPMSCYRNSCILRATLNEAVRVGIIESNPWKLLAQTDKIRVPQSKREFLTIEEVKRLIATPYAKEHVRSAFLFSCFCGLRVSDIRRLRWRDITVNNDQWLLTMVMTKTSAPIYVPLSQQAAKWLPDRGDAAFDDYVFALPTAKTINNGLRDWAKSAGITKHISFHVARHTAATMLLTLGADLYTVSKILGHTDVRTTQIYAKIVDKKKDDAIALLDNAFE